MTVSLQLDYVHSCLCNIRYTLNAFSLQGIINTYNYYGWHAYSKLPFTGEKLVSGVIQIKAAIKDRRCISKKLKVAKVLVLQGR